MKQRQILNDNDLKKAIQDLSGLSGHFPFVITITEGTKIRTTGQNSRYWCEVQYFMDELRSLIEQAEEQTGHTNIEIRHILAGQMPIEQAVILFARKPETVHEILKDICGIPTSTRLGTKAFAKFDERLAQVMSEIIGTVRGILR